MSQSDGGSIRGIVRGLKRRRFTSGGSLGRYVTTLFIQYFIYHTTLRCFSGVIVWTAMSKLTVLTVKTVMNALSNQTFVLLTEAALTQKGHTDAFVEQASGMLVVVALVSGCLIRWKHQNTSYWDIRPRTK